jgi:hypothetical protein
MYNNDTIQSSSPMTKLDAALVVTYFLQSYERLHNASEAVERALGEFEEGDLGLALGYAIEAGKSLEHVQQIILDNVLRGIAILGDDRPWFPSKELDKIRAKHAAKTGAQSAWRGHPWERAESSDLKGAHHE